MAELKVAPLEVRATAGVELLYQPAESVFGVYASTLVGLGWSVFPQEVEGRRPGRVYGEAIRWGEEHGLRDKLPTAAALALWNAHCATLNVACVFGPGSGNTFAVDIDVTDAVRSLAIQEMAEEILGTTPLIREGRAPKIALIYRHGPTEAERIPSLSRRFANVDRDGNAEKSDDGLEILSAGKLITFLGHHHKTGNYFQWLDKNPLSVGPSAAPLVTSHQVQTFLEAVDARFRFHRGSSFTFDPSSLSVADIGGFKIPRIALSGAGIPWSEDDDGKVSDGREAYLTNLAFMMVKDNVDSLDAAQASGDAEVRRFKLETSTLVADQFERTAALTDRWRKTYVRSQAREKVTRLIDGYLSGRVKLKRSRPRHALSEAELVLPVPEDTDGELSFLRANKLTGSGSMSGRGKLNGKVEAPAAGQVSLALPENRTAISQMVQDGLSLAFTSFFTDVYGDPHGYGLLRAIRVHVLKAPTGAGKTSRCIRTIAGDYRTFEDYDWVDPETGRKKRVRAPFVMLLPTYANIDELRTRANVLNLNGRLDDVELRAAAAAAGLIAEDELDSKVADLRRDALDAGLRTMVYSGKIKAGCLVADKVELAMKAGVGSAAFCEATITNKETKEVREERCDFYDSCLAISQRKEIMNSHVVFMPHSFLALAIPEELKQVRAIIADERIHHLFLHSVTFSAMSLSITRKPPKLTKKERAANFPAEDILFDRDEAARIAVGALSAGGCPAEALIDYVSPNGNSKGDGPMLVAAALRVCGSAIQRDGTFFPSMPISDVRELCARPTGIDIREELQFWEIISERISLLRHDRLRNQGIRALEVTLSHEMDDTARSVLAARLVSLQSIPDSACGDRDYRIQLLTDASTNGGTSEIIRISWRTRPNWAGVPMLLLDASAAPPIVAKIWEMPLNDIVVHDIVEDTGMSFNTMIVGVVNQTFSNSSLIASPEASRYERANAARNLAKVRAAITSVASLYGDGRVVVGTSIVLRELINNGWKCPENVDWCHFGALRGLDGFKFHAAAISIGRMEVPIRTIDGLVAALTYDDLDPETPMDVNGTGMDPHDEGQSLRLQLGDQRLRLRSGHVAVLPVPMFSGRWGRLIQKQYREEELLQFVGRLRPVYREGRPPVWFALSSVIPDDLVVDDLIHIEDLLHDRWNQLWEGARKTVGVLHPELLAAACGDLFSDFSKAQDLMYRAGFRPLGEPNMGRMPRGFAPYSWHSGDGNTRVAFVQRGLPDPVGRLRAAFRLHLEIEPRDVREIPSPNNVHSLLARARARVADGVDLRIGLPEERGAREEERLDRIGKTLLNGTGGVEEFPFRRYHFGEGVAARSMSLAELESLYTIDDHWRLKGGIEDSRMLPTAQDQRTEMMEGSEDDDYDGMGAAVRDGDGVMYTNV